MSKLTFGACGRKDTNQPFFHHLLKQAARVVIFSVPDALNFVCNCTALAQSAACTSCQCFGDDVVMCNKEITILILLQALCKEIEEA